MRYTFNLYTHYDGSTRSYLTKRIPAPKCNECKDWGTLDNGKACKACTGGNP